MTAQIWPFAPRDEMIEALEWRTDIMQAKSAEQRFALREAPRRTFNLAHTLTDYQYAAAQALVRTAQGGDGFLVPDWGQSETVGAVSAGSSVALGVDLTYTDIGTTALLWQSETLHEQITIDTDSAGAPTATTVANTYTNARLLPLWSAYAPEGLSATRIGANLNQASIAMVVTENTDLGASDYAQYQGHDILTSCPIIGSGSFEESIQWAVSAFDNEQSAPYYLRQRDLPNMVFTMRWHEFTSANQWTLRRWIHSRRGRQKVFWLSSTGKDFEPAGNAGSVLTVYQAGATDLGRTTFDIDVKANGTNYYRRVNTIATGTPVGGRATFDLTLDSAIAVAVGDITRVSQLRCARFNADRIEFLHRASGGISVQVPCIEVTEP